MAKPIKSTGPVPCDYMVVAERPGREEANRGVVLCGPSGQELNRFLLTECGLDRANVHCRNLVEDYRDGENPEEYEVVRDWPFTIAAIQRVQPRYIMAMGLWSARAFLGHDTDMEWASGLHFPITWECGKFTVMPVTHTAATLHQPKYAARCAADFRAFGKLIRRERLPDGHLQPYRQPSYSDSVIPITGNSVIGVDTEGTVQRPWGLSYSVRPGQASVQHHRQRHRNWNCKAVNEATIVLHNALSQDIPILRHYGVKVQRFEDTMLKAALLGVEPLGLKPLARRHLGMCLDEYSDIVADARRDKALGYLDRVVEWALERTEVTA